MRRAERTNNPMKTKKNAKSKGTILIADYDFGDVGIEQAIIESAGFKLVATQRKNEDEVIENGRDVDGVLAQYAPIDARHQRVHALPCDWPIRYRRGYRRCRGRHPSRHTGHECPEGMVRRGG